VIRALLDTNVLLSGFAGLNSDRSTPGKLLQAWFRGEFTLVCSDFILEELGKGLAKPYFARSVVEVEPEPLLSIGLLGQHVSITARICGVASHPEDDEVLSATASAEVDFLVTGDGPLLQIAQVRGVPIVSPVQFLAILDAGKS